ncbi:hypothetical protein HY024_03680 [Candidatus Curtissbacteria bacterium]|nr:hypothetical protein [Candidatus Curtissbacteria bacterium]
MERPTAETLGLTQPTADASFASEIAPELLQTLSETTLVTDEAGQPIAVDAKGRRLPKWMLPAAAMALGVGGLIAAAIGADHPEDAQAAPPFPSPTVDTTNIPHTPIATATPTQTPPPTMTPSPTSTPEFTPTPTSTSTPTPTATPTQFVPSPTPERSIGVEIKKRIDTNRNGVFDINDQGWSQKYNVWIDAVRNGLLDNGSEPAQSGRTNADGVDVKRFSGSWPQGTIVCAEEVEVAEALETVIPKDCEPVDATGNVVLKLLNRNKEVIPTATSTGTPEKTNTPKPTITVFAPTPVTVPQTGNARTQESSSNVFGIALGGLGALAVAGGATAIALNRREEKRNAIGKGSRRN